MGSADALLIERVRSYLPHLPEPNPYGSLLYLPWLRSRKAVRVTITVAPVSATMASHRSVTPSRVVTRNTAFRLAKRDGHILADVRTRRARQGGELRDAHDAVTEQRGMTVSRATSVTEIGRASCRARVWQYV